MHFWKLAITTCGIVSAFLIAPAFAGTVRADYADDSLYTALGNDPKYQSVGSILWPQSNGTLSNAASGVLISPKWVLTAGHVVDTFTTDNTTRTFNIGGTQYFNGTNYTAVQHFAQPAWNGNVAAGNDIGLMLLGTPVVGITAASRYFSGGELGLTGVVRTRIYLGDKIEYEVAFGGQTLHVVRFNPAEDEEFLPGSTVSISIPAANVRLVATA